MTSWAVTPEVRTVAEQETSLFVHKISVGPHGKTGAGSGDGRTPVEVATQEVRTGVSSRATRRFPRLRRACRSLENPRLRQVGGPAAHG